ncbi:MAG: isochorismate synthase MenF [Puniceicoccaceae bacterium]
MRTVSADRFGARDGEGLLRFLAYCRESAREGGAPRVASISLRVRDLDPLAVLRSIHEPGQPHLYCERSPVSVSGAESAALFTATGGDRFRKAREFVDAWKDRIIATGDLDGWFSGPLFFHSFAFAGENAPGCSVFLPRWQICRTEIECVAVANVRIDPDSALEPEAERILRAHRTFSEMTYGEIEAPDPTPGAVSTSSEDPGRFRERVEAALAEIASGRLSKVVLSRWRDLVAEKPFRPLETLGVLREAFPDCFAFSHSAGDGASWIGATPERLVRRSGGEFATEAIAGSAPRGSGLSADTALGRALLSGDKDLREHGWVVDGLRRALESLGLSSRISANPHLLRLSNVQHLRTAVSGTCPADIGLLRLAEALHPTPAVGGYPRGEALELIRRLEPFERGLYTGFFGWEKPSGDGELAVALRTARVEGARARLFGGAGIVSGSDAGRELEETAIKLEAMTRALTSPRLRRA